MSAVLDPTTSAIAPSMQSQSGWQLVNRQAQAFAASTLVPEAYRNNVANCIIAIEMAHRMGASPLLVMQSLYIVHGTPSWSSKFLIACFNHSGKYSALRYEWTPDRNGCRAWAVEKATGDRLDGPTVTVEMAKLEGWSTKQGSKWKTMPELMLMYRAAAFMIRTYAPEISMGLLTHDEAVDIVREAPSVGAISAVRAALGTAKPIELDPEPDPETGEIDLPASTGTSYAQFADRLVKTADAEIAMLVLDEAQDLPADQQADLAKMYERKFGDKNRGA